MRKWLKKMRIAKNMTMKNVASSAGISECFYSQIESGKRNPAVNVAKTIAKTLEFPWEKFFEEDDSSAENDASEGGGVSEAC